MASDSHMHAGHDHDHAGHDHSGHSHAGHSHDHGHSHTPEVESGNKNRVLLAAAFTTLFMVVEALGGIFSGSLALLADAGHMLTDAVALSFAYIAYRASERPGTRHMTYGFDRMKILVAYTNGLAILAIALWIVVEAVHRVLSPQPVLGGSMMVIAVVGLIVNIGCFAILHGGDRESLNMRGALLHVMGDLLGSVGAILAAGIILLTGWTLADPILSVVVSVILIRSAWSLLKESGVILMEGAPSETDRDAIEADLSAHVGEAADIHHMHVWSLDDRQKMATLHARMKEGTGPDALTMAIKKRLRDFHGINHATIQVEESPLCLDGREQDGHAHEHAA
ncbi:cobalt-zinc-cadmium efflux system protein [Faunimonas pinastri]|uniref:Cobalt-zinc-cadmium efflux system protein n=1 Tax=Faunimonas pinastri TaxID=1855383 RepID=A0A1H9NRZ5_9HYPH|nr:cation diffusion facilitator family transporter [Faunimonas pinastri]SER38445.1 cobalt-zinc-cadmium efflux system protein [Faunimonas pinastri]